MPPRRKPTLLAQGKPRTLGGTKRAWRVRLYAPGEGSTSYQVMFRSPTGDGQPWERVLRRASTETEACDIFTRADVRAARTIRMLGEAYIKDSHERDKHPRTIQGRESRINSPPSAT